MPSKIDTLIRHGSPLSLLQLESETYSFLFVFFSQWLYLVPRLQMCIAEIQDVSGYTRLSESLEHAVAPFRAPAQCLAV
jgi:hypothetical protein